VFGKHLRGVLEFAELGSRGLNWERHEIGADAERLLVE